MENSLTKTNKSAKSILENAKNKLDFAKNIKKDNEPKMIFIDVDSTGNLEEDRIIQIEYIIYSFNNNYIYYNKELCNSGIKIKLEAMEIHSITNEMIEDKPLFKNTNFCKIINENNKSSNYLISQNIRFTLYMLEQENFQNNYTLIDTRTCSSHLLKDMPFYRLTYLKYALGLYNKSSEVISKNKNIMEGLALDTNVLFLELYKLVKSKFKDTDPLSVMTFITKNDKIPL